MAALAADLEPLCGLRNMSRAESLASLSTCASRSGSCLILTHGCGGIGDEEAVDREEPEELEKACEECRPDGSQQGSAGAACAPNAATTPSPCRNGAAQQQPSWPTPPPLDGSGTGAAGGAWPAGMPALYLEQRQAPRRCSLAQLLKQPLAVLSQVMGRILPLGGRPATPRRHRAPAGAGFRAHGLDREDEDGGPLRRVRRCHDLLGMAAAVATAEEAGQKGRGGGVRARQRA
uniref:Uncharacterized protein n=1 Tax=Pyrodinium bahamense TaxID=73915 RepID=A0A7S0FXL2_9DINO